MYDKYKKVYVTGDTHGDFSRIYDFIALIKEPSVIIVAGDFGGVWLADKKYIPGLYPSINDLGREKEKLKLDMLSYALERGKHTLMFVCGNHENFDRLYEFPIKKIFGGLTHEIRHNIFHMMRGEIFNIADLKIFAFGGAFSHDIDGGVLDFNDHHFITKLSRATESHLPYRIKHISWWEQECPSKEELEKGYEVLNSNPYFDYVITHQTNMNVEKKMGINYDGKFGYEFSDFLRAIDVLCDFQCWLFGHYHRVKLVDDKHMCLYDNFVLLTKDGIRSAV